MDFLKRLFGNSGSAEDAKNRLRFVLIHDRTELPPGMLDLIKDDIISVISRRINIDREHVEVNISTDGPENKLLVDIPLLGISSGETGAVKGTAKRSLNTKQGGKKGSR